MELNIWIHLSFSFLLFLHLKHQLLRAFDHIYMQKARYEFLIVIICYYNDGKLEIMSTIFCVVLVAVA